MGPDSDELTAPRRFALPTRSRELRVVAAPETVESSALVAAPSFPTPGVERAEGAAVRSRRLGCDSAVDSVNRRSVRVIGCARRFDAELAKPIDQTAEHVEPGHQYQRPRAKPPKAISPTRTTMIPIHRLQKIASRAPTMTRIPPRPIPPRRRSVQMPPFRASRWSLSPGLVPGMRPRHACRLAELLNVPISWVRESTRSGAMPAIPLGRYGARPRGRAGVAASCKQPGRVVTLRAAR